MASKVSLLVDLTTVRIQKSCRLELSGAQEIGEHLVVDIKTEIQRLSFFLKPAHAHRQAPACAKGSAAGSVNSEANVQEIEVDSVVRTGKGKPIFAPCEEH
jgi:hypothetical protein